VLPARVRSKPQEEASELDVAGSAPRGSSDTLVAVSPDPWRRRDGMNCEFERYVGVGYSGPETANSSPSALRVYEAGPGKEGC
jgi:hypothetical protein